jgi:small subunit ribosomal protein S2
MPIPQVSMRDLLEAGAHFGHHARRWNPKMKPFIFGVRNDIHILDLQQTTPMLEAALKAMRDIAANGGRVLFVGTKRQAQSKIAEAAARCGQYYVNQRWLGGMMTNWKTLAGSINRLRDLEKILAGEVTGYTKKEMMMMTKERAKLVSSIGGIKDMGGQPNAMFIIDVVKEDIAVKEANKLGIPVFAIVDSNADPEGVDYIIPANDDALRAIELYCDLFADAILDGLQAEMSRSGKDMGAAVDVKVEMPKEKNEPAAAEPTPGEAAEIEAASKPKKKKASA